MPKIDCVAFLRKRFKDVDKQTLEDFVKNAEEVRKGTTSLDEFLARSKMDLEDFEKGQLFYKKSQIDNLIKMKSNMELLTTGPLAKNPVEGLKSILHGSWTVTKGSLASVSRHQETLKLKWSRMLEKVLKAKGWYKLLESGELDAQIRQERWELRREGTPGSSGSKIAQEIASTLKKLDTDRAKQKNQAGAFVRIRDDYAGRQIHDANLVGRADKVLGVNKGDPFTAWKNFTMPLLKKETWDMVPNKDAFMKEAWKDMVFGRSGKAIVNGNSDQFIGVPGSYDRGAAMSKARKLHFGEDWHKYSEKFGVPVLDEIKQGIERDARDVGLVSVLGTNPKAQFEGLISRLKTEYNGMKASGDEAKIAQGEKLYNKLSRAEDTLKRDYKILEGPRRGATSDIEEKVAVALNWGRQFEELTKLGSSIFSQFDDPVIATNLIGSQTGEVFKTGARIGAEYIKAFNPKYRKEMAEIMGTAVDYLLGDMSAGHYADTTAEGTFSKLRQGFFWLNGMTGHGERIKTAASIVQSMDLARMSGSEFKDLPPGVINRLSAYNIGPEDWNNIRGTVTDVDGKKFVIPDKLNGNDTHIKLLNYFNDIAELSTSMPQSRERIMMYGDNPSDTLRGAAARMFWQFKGPLVTLPKIASQIYTTNPMKNGDLTALAKFGVMALGAGAVGDFLWSAAAGKPYQLDGKKVMDIIGRSGVGGVGYDYLSAEYERGKRGAAGSALTGALVGPLAGDVAQGIGQAAAYQKGSFRSNEFIDYMKRLTPGQNLWWARQVFVDKVFDEIHEVNDPGYKQKHETKTIQQQAAKGF